MHPEATPVAATLDDQDALVRALDGVDAAFIHLPMPSSPEDPQTWMAAFFVAAHRVSLPLIVYSTSGSAGERFPSSIMIDASTAGMQAVLNGGIPAIALIPNVYLENLMEPFMLPRLQSEGILDYPPVPESLRVQWTSHQDQAVVAAAALTRPDLAGSTYEVGTTDAVTGAELAELLEGYVGRKVTFAPLSPQDFGARIGETFGSPDVGFALTDLYSALASMGDQDMVQDPSEIEEVFDVKLTSVRDHIQSWGRAKLVA